MIEKLALPEIRELLDAGDLSTLGDVLNGWFPADLAGVLDALTDAEKVRVLDALHGPLASQVYEYLDLDTQKRLLAIMTEGESAAILEAMAADDRTALLEELPREYADRLIARLSPGERAVAESLLRYSPDSIGRLMTPDYVAVKKDWTVKHVLDHVRTHGKDSETLNVIYVVDDDHRLVDDLRIRSVLIAPLHQHIRDALDGHFIALKATDDKKGAVAVFRKYDRTVLPVIDARGALVGIVTIDDVLDVAEEEATREIQKFGGLEALDAPYVSTPLLAMVRKRASWLVVLFLGEMLTATAMGRYEGEIARFPVLALFLPLIISSGGNSGSQAATLIIRALALRELKLTDVGYVFAREIASGLLLGGLLGLIGLLRITVWSQFTDIYTEHYLLVGLTVGLSLVGVVLWGTLCGALLPFLLKRLGFDPATSSAPFVATLVDVTGIVIYFTVAFALLRGKLL
ncbi:MAG: magnesium transporter [Planctomycetia bacterium]|nr:magnesium transporter [Planctomycetia bacterium]